MHRRLCISSKSHWVEALLHCHYRIIQRPMSKRLSFQYAIVSAIVLVYTVHMENNRNRLFLEVIPCNTSIVARWTCALCAVCVCVCAYFSVQDATLYYKHNRSMLFPMYYACGLSLLLYQIGERLSIQISVDDTCRKAQPLCACVYMPKRIPSLEWKLNFHIVEMPMAVSNTYAANDDNDDNN